MSHEASSTDRKALAARSFSFLRANWRVGGVGVCLSARGLRYGGGSYPFAIAGCLWLAVLRLQECEDV